MKKIRIEDAVGQTLCHDMTAILADGFKGVRFKRGHVIREEDIPAFLDMGKSHVFVWNPEVDEVHEDDAAAAVSHAACGENISLSGPSEGKFLLTAETTGLFRVNSQALRRINEVDDYTLTCLPGNTPVQAGAKLGGIRIVPLVTKRENVERATAIADESFPVFSVLPYKPLKCGVIITGSEVYYGRIRDQFQPIMEEKLTSFGAEILGYTKCPDDEGMILAAIEQYCARGADLILLTGGMSVDPDDVTPSAIRAAGAEMVTQGVPMQPGNMLTMAYRGNTPLIGVPGASMHSPVTSLDVFLPQIFAGLRITKEQIAPLGEGGFCPGCDICRYPYCGFGHK